MICITSESQLKEAFRSIDQDEVQLPHDLVFPVVLKDYFAWTEPSGHRVFLIYQDPTGRGACGIVFKRASGGAGDGIAQMCQWCHSVRAGNAVRLLTAKASPKRRVGIHVCSDLSCKDKVLEGPGVNDLREPFSRYEKLFRVLLKMSEFTRVNLENLH
jgi:hypothetical protein